MISTKKVTIQSFNKNGHERLSATLTYKDKFDIYPESKESYEAAKKVVEDNSFGGNCVVTFGSEETESFLVLED